MAKNNTKIDYDDEDDILFIAKARKVKSSVDIGDFIIDIDHKGFVSGIEILNASKHLSISSNKLKDIQKASMKVSYHPKQIYITLNISFENKEKEITIPLAIGLGHNTITTTTNFASAEN